MKLLKQLIACCMLLTALPAGAHYIWLEPSAKQANLYFGEYGEDLREVTGGKLDNISSPEASVVKAGKLVPVTYTRQANHLELAVAADQPVVIQDVKMKVKDLRKYNIGIVKPMYYARFATAETEAASGLDFDIQPLGAGKVKVSLHGKPLAKTKLEVIAPNQWMQELQTNDAGEVAVKTPWSGLYVVHVVYVEPAQGTYDGEAYEGVRHVGTLSFIRP